MPTEVQPTFEEWVEYSFTLGHSDFNGTSPSPEAERCERERRFRLDPPLLTSYLTRLFEAPAFVAEQFTDDQIAKGIWYIFGVGSLYTHVLFRGEVPVEQRAHCARAVATMYTDLFDRVCGGRGEDIDSDEGDVDAAVYMLWDMGGIDGIIVAKADDPLSVAGFHILETALMKCVTAACRKSALHGLGHLIGFHAPTAPSATRAIALIDSFLSKRRPREDLKEYAAAARAGNVQ